MPGASARNKGKGGELEVVHVFRDAGVEAERSAPMQAGNNGHGDIACALPGLFIEAKRQERLEIPAWLRKLQADCPEGRTPVLAFRQNRDSWRAVVPLEWLAQLLADRSRQSPPE